MIFGEVVHRMCAVLFGVLLRGLGIKCALIPLLRSVWLTTRSGSTLLSEIPKEVFGEQIVTS